jgi:hypothetical protein
VAAPNESFLDPGIPSSRFIEKNQTSAGGSRVRDAALRGVLEAHLPLELYDLARVFSMLLDEKKETGGPALRSPVF